MRLHLILAIAAGNLLAQQPPPITPRSVPSAEADRTRLRWKRHRVVQNDLARALVLTEAEVCRDVDGQPCVASGRVGLLEWLRVVGLQTIGAPGGGGPPGGGAPPPLTPEQQCAQLQRGQTCQDAPYVDVESASGMHLLALGGNDPMIVGLYAPIEEPMVTTSLALDRYALSSCGERAARDVRSDRPEVFNKFDVRLPSVTPATAGLRDQVIDLYRRLLARDPAAGEADAIMSMAAGTETMSGEQFARLSCYGIATMKEFLFQ
jgi:hypothetical protein